MTQLLPAAYLTCWGTALLLAWVGAQRCIECAHLWLAARWPVRPPSRLLVPLVRPAPAMLAALALMIGVAGSLAFMDQSVQAFPLLDHALPSSLPAAAQWVRLVLAEGVMVTTLVMVSEHPPWKLYWVAGWALFSLAVTSCG
jgi:hypothetical protein